MNFSSNATVYGLSVCASDLHDTLQTAINNAAQHSAAELQSSFISSASNLSVIMNPINKTVDERSFNWRDFSSVASILLNAVEQHPDVYCTFFGVVKDPSGTPVVEVVIVPEYVTYDHDGKPSPPNMDPLTSSSTPTIEKLPASLPKRVPLPRVVPILGTNYHKAITATAGVLHTTFLRTLMASAINMVAMNPNPQRSYTTMITESFGYMFQSPAVNVDGRINFSFRTEPEYQIRHHEILAIPTMIYRTVYTYVYMDNQNRTIPSWSFTEQLLDSNGFIVQRWSLGEISQNLWCTFMTTRQSNGSVVYECLLT